MNKKNCKLKEKKNQKIEFVKKTISHLRGLNLADSNIYNSRLVIDILIGSNYQEFMFTKSVKRKSGPCHEIKSWISQKLRLMKI